MKSIVIKVLCVFFTYICLINFVSIALFNKVNAWLGIGSFLFFTAISVVLIYKLTVKNEKV